MTDTSLPSGLRGAYPMTQYSSGCGGPGLLTFTTNTATKQGVFCKVNNGKHLCCRSFSLVTTLLLKYCAQNERFITITLIRPLLVLFVLVLVICINTFAFESNLHISQMTSLACKLLDDIIEMHSFQK